MSRTRNRKRRIQIIKLLSDMSKNGWAEANFDDYTALEAELARLDR